MVNVGRSTDIQSANNPRVTHRNANDIAFVVVFWIDAHSPDASLGKPIKPKVSEVLRALNVRGFLMLDLALEASLHQARRSLSHKLIMLAFGHAETGALDGPA
jgi:hypothetical protein